MQHDVKLSGVGHELGIQRKEVEKLAGIEKGPRLHSPVRKTHSSDTLKVAPHIHEGLYSDVAKGRNYRASHQEASRLTPPDLARRGRSSGTWKRRRKPSNWSRPPPPPHFPSSAQISQGTNGAESLAPTVTAPRAAAPAGVSDLGQVTVRAAAHTSRAWAQGKGVGEDWGSRYSPGVRKAQPLGPRLRAASGPCAIPALLGFPPRPPWAEQPALMVRFSPPPAHRPRQPQLRAPALDPEQLEQLALPKGWRLPTGQTIIQRVNSLHEVAKVLY